MSLPVLTAAGAGMLLGVFFFGGLWATLTRLPAARRPALWLLGTLLLRLLVVLAGFYLIARHAGWQGLLAGAAGFTVARLLAMAALRPRTARGRTPS